MQTPPESRPPPQRQMASQACSGLCAPSWVTSLRHPEQPADTARGFLVVTTAGLTATLGTRDPS